MPPVDSIAPGENTIRILLTTDNHVGFLENDPVRGDDSWITFQEIIALAKAHDVDLIVQGGDLFHVSRPSKKSLYHVIQLLRLNCLGDRPCELELLSDPAVALRAGDSVNYEDPNMNVAVPVFAISGNHDDATGEGLLLPMDVLAATGLINYFGQVPRLDKITVAPLVFQKGTTKLALYGINNMRDERLQRIMRNGDVTFQKPRDADAFFNFLCVHQNHHRHTMTSFVPEDFFPSFLDFVLWGHEHECIPFPQYNPTTGFDTLQPGSLVATSLSDAETAQKHVFVMDIKDKSYSLTPIPLQTVRPFIMRDISLSDERLLPGPASKADILELLTLQVEDMIALADSEKLPLIRLRVAHSGEYVIENSRRFSNKFVGKVANVNDILLYHKKPVQKTENGDRKPDFRAPEPPVSLNVSIQQILREYLGDSNLYLVPEDSMFDVTKKFIEQEDKQIFTEYVENTVASATQLLQDINIDEAEFHVGDEQTIKRSFRQLLNKLRYDSKRRPIEDLLELAQVAAEKAKLGNLLLLDGEEQPRRSLKPKPRSKAVVDSDSESDFSPEEIEPPKPKSRAKSAKAPAKRARPATRQTQKKPRKEASSLDDLLSLG